MTWDPSTPRDGQGLIQATQDNKPFVVLNANGYRASSVACITVDNETPVICGDPMYNELSRRRATSSFSLLPPPRPPARPASVVAKQGLIPKTAKIGILLGTSPDRKAAGDALEASLKKNGLNPVSKVEVNITGPDAPSGDEPRPGPPWPMKADRCRHGVHHACRSPRAQGYFEEANQPGAGFKAMRLEGSTSICTIFAAEPHPARRRRHRALCHHRPTRGERPRTA